MKDYRLSEIKNHNWNELWDLSDDIAKRRIEFEFLRKAQYSLEHLDIEPRDMIELPYINEIDRSNGAYTLDGKSYEVVFRDDDGSIKVKPVSSKEAAKEVIEFLLQKKEKK